MNPTYGDIVIIPSRADGERWVMTPSGSYSHNHVPLVRLLNTGRVAGTRSQHQSSAFGLSSARSSNLASASSSMSGRDI